MGKLIKNHLARLVILTAASCTSLSSLSSMLQRQTPFTNSHPFPTTDQVWASLHAFFWPKLLFDFLTVALNRLVKPVPILQILNLLFGLSTLALEAPLPWVAGTAIHASIELRLLFYPACALLCALMYQATDPAGFYVIGMILYFWAFSEGEAVCKVPFTLPKKSRGGGGGSRV